MSWTMGPHSSSAVCFGFSRWLRPFGAPEMLMTDGGAEFEAVFSRGCERAGILHHVIPANSPHQNGKCERRGGLVKDALSKAALAISPASAEEVDLLLCE
eukprot:6186623-Pyramimonas_sp.AAC.1